jgi:hypothetical protein
MAAIKFMRQTVVCIFIILAILVSLLLHLNLCILEVFYMFHLLLVVSFQFVGSLLITRALLSFIKKKSC